MKRIRTKLILSLLAVTLLPVYPVYYLVKNLLHRSLAIGYNQNVEMALESASGITRSLYAKYKAETLTVTNKIADLCNTKKINFNRPATEHGLGSCLQDLEKYKVLFYDNTGQLINALTNSELHNFPQIYQTDLAAVSKKTETEILESPGGVEHIVAFAPLQQSGIRVGSLIVINAVTPEFTEKAQAVFKVLQMFKTLDFYESELKGGFITSFLVVYVPIALFSIALGIYFSSRITSPLRSLVGGTKKVAAGDWDYRLQVKTRDEIGDLVHSFNHMMSTLKEQQEQVIALEKMAVWREIARVLAHEIKNPLTPIQLTVQQMKDKYTGNDTGYQKLINECAGIVNDEIESLRTLVREFSEFARMPQLNPAPGNLNVLIEEVRKLYPNDNISLVMDSSLPAFDFDWEKMRRVLINLIDNSMDSICEKGAGDIKIKTIREGRNVILEYSDTGNGIQADIQKKIFEPYFSTKKSGMGLGMAIVKRIVTEHGGRIVLESEEKKGTKFTITLPI